MWSVPSYGLHLAAHLAALWAQRIWAGVVESGWARSSLMLGPVMDGWRLLALLLVLVSIKINTHYVVLKTWVYWPDTTRPHEPTSFTKFEPLTNIPGNWSCDYSEVKNIDIEVHNECQRYYTIKQYQFDAKQVLWRTASNVVWLVAQKSRIDEIKLCVTLGTECHAFAMREWMPGYNGSVSRATRLKHAHIHSSWVNIRYPWCVFGGGG